MNEPVAPQIGHTLGTPVARLKNNNADNTSANHIISIINDYFILFYNYNIIINIFCIIL